MAKRSKPLVIAPVIPLLGIIGIFGVDRLAHTRYLTAFVVVWVVRVRGIVCVDREPHAGGAASTWAIGGSE